MWKSLADCASIRIVEDEIESAIESRTEALNALRELGPPDLVHLVKQSVKSGGRQVRLCHWRPKDLITFQLDRGLPSCYWGRCFLIRHIGCISQHPHLLSTRQDAKSHLRNILVGTDGLSAQ